MSLIRTSFLCYYLLWFIAHTPRRNKSKNTKSVYIVSELSKWYYYRMLVHLRWNYDLGQTISKAYVTCNWYHILIARLYYTVTMAYNLPSIHEMLSFIVMNVLIHTVSRYLAHSRCNPSTPKLWHYHAILWYLVMNKYVFICSLTATQIYCIIYVICEEIDGLENNSYT